MPNDVYSNMILYVFLFLSSFVAIWLLYVITPNWFTYIKGVRRAKKQKMRQLAPFSDAATSVSDCKNAHNNVRKNHKGTNPLQWDTAMAKRAQAWADECCHKSGQFAHSKRDTAFRAGGDGENIAGGSGAFTCGNALGNW